MEEAEYKDNERVYYRTSAKLKLPHKEPEEVTCLVTEGHVLIEAEESIKIPLSLIKDISIHAYPATDYSAQAQGLSYGTANLTFLDEQNKKRKLSLDATSGSLAYFKETVNEVIRRQTAKPRTDITLEFASFGRRLFAIIIDSILLGIIDGVVSSIISSAAKTSDTPAGWNIAGGVMVALIPMVYFVWAYSGSGKTPGKSMLGIRVVSIDGSPLNWRKGFLRYLGYLTSTIVLFIGFFWLIWDRDKQAWHDKIAGTCVVRDWVTSEVLQDATDVSQAHRSQRKWLLGLGIPTILLSFAVYGVGLFDLIESGTEQEHPLITSWRSEDLLESAQFVSTQVSVSGIQPFTVLELQAVVPTGTLDDGGKTERLADRFASDITATEDLFVVVLIEETGFGCTMSRWKCRGYPKVGEEHLYEQRWEAYQSLPSNMWNR